VLPEQVASSETRQEKYNKHDETTVEEIRSRVCTAAAAPEPAKIRPFWESQFQRLMAYLGGLPAGRILSAAGVDSVDATWINCFVQKVGDWLYGMRDGVPGILDAQAQAGRTLSLGGGVGFDFSLTRPKTALVKGALARASGPLSWMRSFDTMCQEIRSAGGRRGAMMAVLRVDHPDIRDFIVAKNEPGEFTQFNLSVAVTRKFLDALQAGKPFELVHDAAPFDPKGAVQRVDGKWVYDTVDPKELWDLIMHQTYDHAEPGVLFIDRANEENNLYYCETFEATNPCAEQFLPPHGCCDLGSINLTKHVTDPFTDEAAFNFETFEEACGIMVRLLDNVLDATPWPLEEQRLEALSKRRTGQGFLGLGNALCMLGVRYNSPEGRRIAAKIAEAQCHAAYRASIEIAKEKGAFPLFDAEKYLASKFVQRLPEDIREGIREHGIRNSHLLSIAPTGTISLSMADNASNGIEPAFNWHYMRKKRMDDGGFKHYPVVDHAFRLYCVTKLGVDPVNSTEDELDELVDQLPDYFVSALEMTAQDHLKMVAAVQPYVDSSISKTVNIPADYPFEDFKYLYSQADSCGLKGLATFRPNDITGSVLSNKDQKDSSVNELTFGQSDIDRRLMIDTHPDPVMGSLRWPKRPKLPNGNPSRTYMVKTDDYSFAVFVGYTENGTNHPFEVWVNGSEQPRGLGAIAKAMSMDMRSNDRAFLMAKLDSLERSKGDDGCVYPIPPDGREVRVPSLVSLFAKLVKHCIEELEAYPPRSSEGHTGQTDLIGTAMTPMMDALMSRREPKTSDGTMAWCVDVRNHGTGDDFVLMVKELVMPDGQRRPFSVWMSGEYPRVFDGLCKVLSFDMRILDPAWVGAKLRSLLDFAEPGGNFMAKVPDSKKSATFPSTVAYVAQLLIHRYAMLGILDEDGFPVTEAGLMDAEYHNEVSIERSASAKKANTGRLCGNCKTYSVVRRDGCDWCEECGEQGGCG
jgi:ribonucleoside-diphosphate reductase alpha chain